MITTNPEVRRVISVGRDYRSRRTTLAQSVANVVVHLLLIMAFMVGAFFAWNGYEIRECQMWEKAPMTMPSDKWAEDQCIAHGFVITR